MTESEDSKTIGFPIDIDAGASNYNLSENDRLKVEAHKELWASIHKLALLQILEGEIRSTNHKAEELL